MSDQRHAPATLLHGNYPLSSRLSSHRRSGCCGEEKNLCRDSNHRWPVLKLVAIPTY